MAKKIYSTIIALPAPFMANSCDPVDARTVVELFSDLTTNAESTFGVIGGTYCKVHEGIQVYVSNEKSTYMYVGPSDSNGILLTEVQKTENWRKVSDETMTPEGLQDKLDTLEDEIAKNKVVPADASITVGAPTETGTPISVKIKASGNALKLGDEGLYVDSAVLTQYTGADSISVTGDGATKTIKLNINASDNVLTQSADGLLANINLSWSKEEGLKLIGKNSTVITTIPATDFIKDGMLDDVEFVESGAVTYIRFTFNTSAGKAPIDLDVTKLIDVYTAGNGISVTGNTISAIAATSDPVIEVTESGIATKADAVWDCGTY